MYPGRIIDGKLKESIGLEKDYNTWLNRLGWKSL
jgi:hypothetical protein